MANPDPPMSSSRRSGSVASNSRRRSGSDREIARPASPVCHTLSNQTQSKPRACDRVELVVGHVVERGGTTEDATALGQPGAGVDLVELRVPWPGHVRARSSLTGRSPSLSPAVAASDVLPPTSWRPISRRQPLRSRTGAAPRAMSPVQPVWWLAPEPGPVVAVEVLVEQDQVAPVRVVLEALRRAVDRPPAVLVAQEDRGEPAARSPRPPGTGSSGVPEPVGHSTVKSSP